MNGKNWVIFFSQDIYKSVFELFFQWKKLSQVEQVLTFGEKKIKNKTCFLCSSR